MSLEVEPTNVLISALQQEFDQVVVVGVKGAERYVAASHENGLELLEEGVREIGRLSQEDSAEDLSTASPESSEDIPRG